MHIPNLLFSINVLPEYEMENYIRAVYIYRKLYICKHITQTLQTLCLIQYLFAYSQRCNLLFVKSLLKKTVKQIGQRFFYPKLQKFFTYSDTNISERLALVICVYHFPSIVHRHLGCFYVLAMNNATMNFGSVDLLRE